MATTPDEGTGNGKRIVVRKDGSYAVEGGIPLVRKTQVVSEHGEPLTWQKEGGTITSEAEYRLCRCGQSGNKPFCDGTHRKECFDGTETANTGPTKARQVEFPGGTHIIVRKDPSLCMESGFCSFKDTGIEQLVTSSADTKTRALVMAMVERCPSGALTYRIEAGKVEIEPDLPEQVALTTEITSAGPIAGPLWVTGGIPVVRSDGKPFETRNRVTLCNCGYSDNKPLCDGTHRGMAECEQRSSRDGTK